METVSQPFSNFARVYDSFMHFVDYEGWTKYVRRLLEFYDIKGKKLLDLACGTGRCSVLFAEEGFEVTGIDISESMLDAAKVKKESTQYNIKYFCRDIRKFEVPERSDIVISIYDSLNYILEKNGLQDTFSCVYNALENEGIFIFDMNTEYALKHIWGTGKIRRNEGGIKTVWENVYDDATKIATLHLTWQVKEDGKKKEYFELHRETSYPNEEILEMLKKAGFSLSVIYAHGSFMPPVEFTPRIMVVAIK